MYYSFLKSLQLLRVLSQNNPAHAIPLRPISSLMFNILEYFVRIFHASLPPKSKILQSSTRPRIYGVPTCFPYTC